jgi:hypothetical protein
MSPTKPEISPQVAQVATPTYPLTDDLLGSALAALPKLIPDAPPAWHRTHRKWVTKEIAAFHPRDAVQALLAGQVVVARHLAASLMGRAGLRATSLAWARRLGRIAAGLMRTSERTGLALRRVQKNATPPGGAWAACGLDLAATDAAWRSEVIQRETGLVGRGSPPHTR